ncbi:MAG TPA: hypothetical protein VF062_04970 [Candidatus Limnocylindrales bacterium]
MNLQALRQALVDIATGVITRTLAVQGRIESGIRELEKWANEEGKR